MYSISMHATFFCTKISAGSDGLRWEALITFHGMTRLISDTTHNILLNNDYSDTFG